MNENSQPEAPKLQPSNEQALLVHELKHKIGPLFQEMLLDFEAKSVELELIVSPYDFHGSYYADERSAKNSVEYRKTQPSLDVFYKLRDEVAEEQRKEPAKNVLEIRSAGTVAIERWVESLPLEKQEEIISARRTIPKSIIPKSIFIDNERPSITTRKGLDRKFPITSKEILKSNHFFADIDTKSENIFTSYIMSVNDEYGMESTEKLIATTRLISNHINNWFKDNEEKVINFSKNIEDILKKTARGVSTSSSPENMYKNALLDMFQEALLTLLQSLTLLSMNKFEGHTFKFEELINKAIDEGFITKIALRVPATIIGPLTRNFEYIEDLFILDEKGKLAFNKKYSEEWIDVRTKSVKSGEGKIFNPANFHGCPFAHNDRQGEDKINYVDELAKLYQEIFNKGVEFKK